MVENMMISRDVDSRMDADLYNCINCEKILGPALIVLGGHCPREVRKLTWQELRKTDKGNFAFTNLASGG